MSRVGWSLKITLLSEAIFGNGQSVPVEVDLDAVKDAYGFPYYGAKALKGHWREQTEFVAKALSQSDKCRVDGTELNGIVEKAFGKSGMEESTAGVLHISDAVVPEETRRPFIQAVKRKQVIESEIFRSLTSIRSFTALNSDTGAAEPHTLRKIRVVHNKLTLVSKLSFMDELTDNERGLLAAGAVSIHYIGMMKNRGKGHVSCRLIRDGDDLTFACINDLRKWVIGQ